MNKKLFFAGAIAVAGFATLTAFGGRTKAQQDADIAAAVEARLTEVKTAEAAKCDERVAAEATTRFDAAYAAKMEEAANSKTVPGKKPAVKKGTGGPKAPALPPATKPVDPAQAKKDKTAGTAPVNTDAKQSKTAGEAPPPNTSAKKAKTAGQPAGGGN
jgi:hypothetical protein